MSYGAVVHASLAEREVDAERRAAEARQTTERRRAWALEHLADLPTEMVVVAIGMLRFGHCEPTVEAVRERVERQLRRLFGDEEVPT